VGLAGLLPADMMEQTEMKAKELNNAQCRQVMIIIDDMVIYKHKSAVECTISVHKETNMCKT